MKISYIVLISIIILINSLFAQHREQIHRIDSVVVIAEKDQPIPRVSSIATKTFESLKNIPLSVGVVNNSLINDQNNLILGDALKNVSGINTQTGNGVHDYFIIRGMNSLENGLILTDGTLEPEVTYYNLYNIERIEVLKGPGSFLYGSNPLSGTVNLVRKQPQFRNFLNLTSSFGQFNSFRNSVDANYGDQDQGLAARLNLLYESAENFRDEKENKILAANPSILYLAGKDLMLNLNFEFIKSEYKPDSGLPLVFDPTKNTFTSIAEVDRKNSYQSPSDFSDQRIIRVKMYSDYSVDQNISLHSKFYFSQLDWKTKGTLINGAYPNMTGSMDVYRSLSQLSDVRNLFGLQKEINLQLITGKIKHNLMAGFELNLLNETYEYDVAPFIPSLNLINPTDTFDENQLVLFPYLRGDVKNLVIAPYLVDQITFSEKLQIIVGLRYDIINFENKEPSYISERNYNNFSPMLGLNYSFSNNISLFMNAGRAYAPPSSQIIGEQDAERSQQFEIGVKQSYFNERINIDFSYYYLTKDNITIPSIDGLSKQLGDQVSQGLETEIRMELTEDWFTFVSYAFTEVELTKFLESVFVGQDEFGNPQNIILDRSGNRPAFTPKHILNIWSTRELVGGLGIGAGFRYLSEQFISSDNIFELDEAIIFDAILYYKWNRFKVSLNLKNITDEKYEMRGFSATSVIPANPRSIYGTIGLAL